VYAPAASATAVFVDTPGALATSAAFAPFSTTPVMSAAHELSVVHGRPVRPRPLELSVPRLPTRPAKRARTVAEARIKGDKGQTCACSDVRLLRTMRVL